VRAPSQNGVSEKFFVLIIIISIIIIMVALVPAEQFGGAVVRRIAATHLKVVESLLAVIDDLSIQNQCHDFVNVYYIFF
jgi:hypothetical protein